MYVHIYAHTRRYGSFIHKPCTAAVHTYYTAVHTYHIMYVTLLPRLSLLSSAVMLILQEFCSVQTTRYCCTMLIQQYILCSCTPLLVLCAAVFFEGRPVGLSYTAVVVQPTLLPIIMCSSTKRECVTYVHVNRRIMYMYICTTKRYPYIVRSLCLSLLLCWLCQLDLLPHEERMTAAAPSTPRDKKTRSLL